MTKRIGGTVLAFTAALLVAGCSPVYLSDTYATATPRPASFDVGALAHEPVATLELVAPASLQGFSPNVSLALATALAEVSPPLREISTFETINRLTDQGLAAEYADLLSGFGRNGILERQRLRRIGSGLGARYVMLPGLAQLDETVIDKFVASALGCAIGPYRVGIGWGNHRVDCASEPQANRPYRGDCSKVVV
jgi:hypothetical protein